MTPPSGNSKVYSHVSLNLLRNVTNRQPELIKELMPMINRTFQLPIQKAVVSLYRNQEPLPEIEPYFESLSLLNGEKDLYCRILSKHATKSGFARNKLLELAESSDMETSILSLLALGAHENTSHEAELRLDELLPKIPLEDWTKNSQYITFEDLFLDPVLWKDASENIRLIAANVLIGRVRNSKSWDFSNERVFFWIVDMIPDLDEVWDLFDRINDSAPPVDVAANLRMLGRLSTPSEAAFERLHKYAASDYTPFQIAANEALDTLRLKGVIPSQKETTE